MKLQDPPTPKRLKLKASKQKKGSKTKADDGRDDERFGKSEENA